jgi:hypothetical protein
VPERVVKLARELAAVAEEKINAITKVTKRTHLLALNARIEGARAGAQGAGFTVVASEVGEVSKSIEALAASLTEELSSRAQELDLLGQRLVSDVRGTRLADLARNAIEIVDRNLYERSCDVRWWATDSAVVDACSAGTPEAMAFAGRRLGVILDSYTVYLDLWLADLDGRVIANGRPDRYPGVRGLDVSGTSWFRSARATASGAEFAVTDVELNPALENRSVATYAAVVREGGETHGRPLGVLGIFFNWQDQAQDVVGNLPLSDDERRSTRCLLVDSGHRVIAASDGRGLMTEHLRLETGGSARGSYLDPHGATVGFCLTPGYETYDGLGWYGVVVQQPRG